MAKPFVDIEMIGDKELERDLKKFDEKNQRRIARAGLKKGAEPTLALAKALVPKDKGLLAAALDIRPARGRRNQIGVEISTGTREQLQIDDDDEFYYPAVVEYGSRNVPARSFLRSSFDQTEEQVIAVAGEHMAKNIVRTLKRHAKR